MKRNPVRVEAKDCGPARRSPPHSPAAQKTPPEESRERAISMACGPGICRKVAWAAPDLATDVHDIAKKSAQLPIVHSRTTE